MNCLTWIACLVYLTRTLVTGAKPCNDKTEMNENNPSLWKCLADQEISRFTQTYPFSHLYATTRRPKNVILFIGDGLSLSTVTGARYLKAEQKGKQAGQELLSWEQWPGVTLLHTMSSNRMTTDSAASGTALFCGAKGMQRTLGLTHGADCCDCRKIGEMQYVKSIFLHAQDAGLSTGIVTTTRVTHATPAAAYAKIPNRDWEAYVDNGNLEGSNNRIAHCQDIAKQMVSAGLDFNVIFGGGVRVFHNTSGKGGQRRDGQNLLEVWSDKQKKKNRRYELVTSRAEFDKLDTSQTDYVLGLFSTDHMQFEIDRTDEPSLAEMTDRAIRILQRNPRGFLLLVEGGRIDHGHHMNEAKYALTETLSFEEAVNVGVNLTKPKETMMVVTADHSQAYHLVGYASRSTSVLDIDETQAGDDNLPYLISDYANGPGAVKNKPRDNPLERGKPTDVNYKQQALVPLHDSTHEAEDVPLYVTGAYSQLYQRPTDNTYVAYATMFALCLGPYSDAAHCNLGTTIALGSGQNALLLVSIIVTHISQWR